MTIESVPFGDEENYRIIDGFDGIYAVGKDGSVWSSWQSEWNQLNPATNRDGYRVVRLVSPSTRKQMRVARLVLTAFSGPCPEDHQACHGNGIPHDDRLSNLRWDSSKKNHQDRHRHGTVRSGGNHGCAKLTREQAQSVVDMYRDGVHNWAKLSRSFGISAMQAKRIVTGETWSDLDREGVTVVTQAYRRLSDDDVRHIRKSMRTQAELAKQFNVSRPLISLIKQRLSYTHVED